MFNVHNYYYYSGSRASDSIQYFYYAMRLKFECVAEINPMSAQHDKEKSGSQVGKRTDNFMSGGGSDTEPK
jgi:hypothetical protein